MFVTDRGEREAVWSFAVATDGDASLCPLHVPLQSLVSRHTEAHDKLRLSNVTEKDAGKYWCRASNFVGKSENAFWLKIHKPGKSPRRPAAAIIPAPGLPVCGSLGCWFDSAWVANRTADPPLPRPRFLSEPPSLNAHTLLVSMSHPFHRPALLCLLSPPINKKHNIRPLITSRTSKASPSRPSTRRPPPLSPVLSLFPHIKRTHTDWY